VSTIEELLERKSSSSGLEIPEYGSKLALTSPTSGGRSVGIVRSQTQVTELVFCLFFFICNMKLGRIQLNFVKAWI
jgi:hypothetical protein